MTQLDTLVLGVTDISDPGLVHLSPLVNLRILVLTGNYIDGTGLKFMSGCSRLMVLDLDETDVSDEGLEWIKRIKSLDHISILHTKVTEGAVNELRNAFPKNVIRSEL